MRLLAASSGAAASLSSEHAAACQDAVYSTDGWCGSQGQNNNGVRPRRSMCIHRGAALQPAFLFLGLETRAGRQQLTANDEKKKTSKAKQNKTKHALKSARMGLENMKPMVSNGERLQCSQSPRFASAQTSFVRSVPTPKGAHASPRHVPSVLSVLGKLCLLWLVPRKGEMFLPGVSAKRVQRQRLKMGFPCPVLLPK